MFLRKFLGVIVAVIVFIITTVLALNLLLYLFGYPLDELGTEHPLLKLVAFMVAVIIATTVYNIIKGEEPPETEEKPKALTNEEIRQKLKEKRNS